MLIETTWPGRRRSRAKNNIGASTHVRVQPVPGTWQTPARTRLGHGSDTCQSTFVRSTVSLRLQNTINVSKGAARCCVVCYNVSSSHIASQPPLSPGSTGTSAPAKWHCPDVVCTDVAQRPAASTFLIDTIGKCVDSFMFALRSIAFPYGCLTCNAMVR